MCCYRYFRLSFTLFLFLVLALSLFLLFFDSVRRRTQYTLNKVSNIRMSHQITFSFMNKVFLGRKTSAKRQHNTHIYTWYISTFRCIHIYIMNVSEYEWNRCAHPTQLNHWMKQFSKNQRRIYRTYLFSTPYRSIICSDSTHSCFSCRHSNRTVDSVNDTHGDISRLSRLKQISCWAPPILFIPSPAFVSS